MQSRGHDASVPWYGVDVVATLAAAGFDIAHTFDAAAAAQEPGLEMLAGPARLGVLIGNTRALWPPFTAALRDPALAAESDPLDRYTERVIDAAFAVRAARVYYGHRRHGGSFLPMQRLAVATGLGALTATHLVVHPDYGPWFALRAVAVVDGEPPVRVPIGKPCHCNASCDAAFARARDSRDWRDWLSVRDSCALRTWRYSDEQIRFHYLRLCQVLQ
jgi:methylmalonic aciduria homocystinuria type C protein